MLRVGIIGYGYWGPNLARNFAETEGVRVAAICDRDAARLGVARRRHPDARTTTVAETMFDDPVIDAVVIATPVSTHYELALAALRAGKHVLVEKPLAASSREAEDLKDAAEENARVLLVDHTFVYTGAVRKARETVDTIGKLYYFDSVRVNLGLCQPDIDVIWDLAPHDLSILAALTDEAPISVSAIGADHVGAGFATMAYLTIRYPSGLIAHIHVNWLSPVKVRKTLVCGGKQMMVYDDLEPSEKLRIYDKGITRSATETRVDYRIGDMRAPKLDNAEALAVECAHFVDCIEHNAAPITGAREGLEVVRLLEAASRSMKTGEAVTL